MENLVLHYLINCRKKKCFAAIEARSWVWILEKEGCFLWHVIFHVSFDSSRSIQKTLEQIFGMLIVPKDFVAFSPWGFMLKLIIYLNFRKMWATKSGGVLFLWSCFHSSSICICYFKITSKGRRCEILPVGCTWHLIARKITHPLYKYTYGLCCITQIFFPPCGT